MAHSMSLKWDLFCVRNIHFWVQDILEMSVKFDGDRNNTNLQTVLTSRNTQHRGKKFIISTIKCKKTESLPQAGNNNTTNLREHSCKGELDEI